MGRSSQAFRTIASLILTMLVGVQTAEAGCATDRLRALLGRGRNTNTDAAAGRTRPIPTTDRPFVYTRTPTRSERLADAIGTSPSARADRRLNAQLSDAPRNYNETGREVLDTESAGSRSRLAQSMSGSDTFGNEGVFRGSIDELVKSGSYANQGRYDGLGGYSRWWERVSFDGRQSFSPIRQAAERAEEGVTYERSVIWQRDQLPAERGGRAQPAYPTAFERFGVAENVSIRNGRRTVDSVEVLARRSDGTIEPFYYVRDPASGELVMSRTFKGQPVEKACVGCHHNPAGSRTVLTQLPYGAMRASGGVNGLADTYRPAANRIAMAEGISPPVPRGAEAPSASVQLAQRNTASFRRDSNGVISDVADQREAIEIVTGNAPSVGPQRAAINRVGDVRFRGTLDDAGKAVERYNLLRYNMTTEELAAYRSANGGSNPASVFTEQDIRLMRDANIFGPVSAP